MDDRDLEALRHRLASEGPGLASDIANLATESRRRRQARAAAVRRKIRRRWGPGLELMDAVVFASQQNAAALLDRANEFLGDHRRLALSLVHCAGTLVLQEVVTLAQAGYWGGAAARWRALHELSVTAVLLGQSDAELAERYINHGFVVQTRHLDEYQASHGRGPLAPSELAHRKRQSEALCKRYADPNGRYDFAKPYGWALPLMTLGSTGRRLDPTLSRLEEIAGLEHMRDIVFSSHAHVHADSAGAVTAVLLDPKKWSIGPHESFLSQAARPALWAAGTLNAATLLGFEEEWNDFARWCAMTAAGVHFLVEKALEAIPPEAPPT